MKTITIVGGGLAGLTLGIALRQQGVPVTVLEAGRYPRHRVCGEFISGRGQQTLERLGLREIFLRAGARPALSAAFFSAKSGGPARELPTPALCLSRYVMDDLLAGRFRELGGDLLENTRWPATELGEGLVRASGRRAQPSDQGWRWIGLKIHAHEVPQCADLEIHLGRKGYVGLCQLGRGEVNICGLFRGEIEAGGPSQLRQQLLRGSEGSPLWQRLAAATFVEGTFCAVAGLVLRPQRAQGRNECCIGDALTMIPPVTGNGMSMAFESAELAIEPLAAFACGKASWKEAQCAVARRCDGMFARRLTWASWLHRSLFVPELQETLVRLVPRWTGLWRLLFESTR